MEQQLKKGILEALILSYLKSRDYYGYELKDEVDKVIKISESTLYPILRRLEAKECLTTYNEENNSRIRKYYKITEFGIDYLNNSIKDWTEIKNLYLIILDNMLKEPAIENMDDEITDESIDDSIDVLSLMGNDELD